MHIQAVHAPRSFDHLASIDARSEVRSQRVNIADADVAGGVHGDVPVCAEPQVNLDMFADRDAVVAITEILRFEPERAAEIE